jgi:ABC-type sugar transport system ATPase subunit
MTDEAGPRSDPLPAGSARSPLRLDVAGVAKTYGAVQALDDVSLAVRGGEVHGVCGHNGAGKSTLMKVLTGLVQPDAGSLQLDGEEIELRDAKEAQRHGITIVDQESGVVPALSVAESLFLGNVGESMLLRKRRTRERARALLARLGVDIDPRARVGELQPGERKLVEIAHALGRDARLIILDEPSASLSHGEARVVFKAVRDVVAQGTAVLFVSHRLDEVFELCDRVTVLRDGRRVDSRPIGELDRRSLVELMVGEEGREIAERVRVEAVGPAVRIAGLAVPPTVEDFELDVAGGAIVGLAGQVGSGASEVLRGIVGLARGATGELEIGGRAVRIGWAPAAVRAGVRYVPGDRKTEGLFMRQSIESNLTATRLGSLSRFGVVSLRARRRVAEGLVKAVAVRDHGVKDRVESLSGGNQQKVLLGRTLERSAGELLLLDDPTRGVDVAGRAEIHRLVRAAAAAGNTVIFVSTELDELLELADVVVTMYQGRIVAKLDVEETSRSRILAQMTHEAAA